jgi:hypothetical protein
MLKGTFLLQETPLASIQESVMKKRYGRFARFYVVSGIGKAPQELVRNIKPITCSVSR